MSGKVPRRRFLAGAGVGVGAAALFAPASAQALAIPSSEDDDTPPLQDSTVYFDGRHQAGVTTRRQTHARFIGFNLVEGVERDGLRNLMRAWTDVARHLCEGEPLPNDLAPELGQVPANLTVTLGLGGGAFIAAERPEEAPAWLDLFGEGAEGEPPTEDDDAPGNPWAGADLLLQICADDPMTVSHCSRMLIREGSVHTEVAWLQDGFVLPDGSLRPGENPRGMFGPPTGLTNPVGDVDLERTVWIEEGPAWIRGGTAVVLRRRAIDFAAWDAVPRMRREALLGVSIDDGRPNGGGEAALREPPEEFPNQRMLDRPYSFDDGAAQGEVEVFFQKDPETQFVPIEERLAEPALLDEWVSAEGSAVFVVPRGVLSDEYWAQDLLAGS